MVSDGRGFYEKNGLDFVDKIETRSPQIVEEYRKKITEKVEQLLGDTQIDENL